MKKTIILSSAGKGRGVYADEPIKNGEVIETCELILLNYHEVTGLLERYVFEFNQEKAALALGHGSLYNHHQKPNAQCFIDDKSKLLYVESTKNIKKGEEITINYGYSKEDKKRFNIV
jgi:SET domain-containing protein